MPSWLPGFCTSYWYPIPWRVTIDAQFSTLNGPAFNRSHSWRWPSCNRDRVPNSNYQSWKTADEWLHLAELCSLPWWWRGDYGHTKRQQQVISAVLEQVKDPTKLFTGSEALGKVFGMTSTNLPYSFLLTNGLSVLEGAQNGIEDSPSQNLVTGWTLMISMVDKDFLVDQNKYQTKLAQMGVR